MFSPKVERLFSQPVRADDGPEITASFTRVTSSLPMSMEAWLSAGSLKCLHQPQCFGIWTVYCKM